MSFDYNPDYVPSGPNQPVNEYYKKINHVRLAKMDSNKQEFFGTSGGTGGPVDADASAIPDPVTDQTIVFLSWRANGSLVQVTYEASGDEQRDAVLSSLASLAAATTSVKSATVNGAIITLNPANMYLLTNTAMSYL